MNYQTFIKMLNDVGADYEQFELGYHNGQIVVRVYNDNGEGVDFTFSQNEKCYMIN